ncbi:MAG: hypothetical protein A3D39_00260 [Candidatus Buchananbacteria bacterium RIFCSPHIGHO2_02_FULL_39_17]|nr:MAG: hypothetical protein A3D39_00260 [Candidatus Buchananbacteria bacterium RIFCSPHIGHO2_02_FULL_39_17]
MRLNNRTFILGGFLGVLGVAYSAFLFGANGTSFFSFGFNQNQPLDTNTWGLVQEAHAAAGSVERYNYLSVQRSSSCGLQPATVDMYSDEQNIQGSCCSKMDLHRYQEQVEGLKKYSEIDVIPKDPYDISAALAKRLFGYQQNITLTSTQQAIYDQAVELSDEGGPCCCKCWRWYAFEGQAKYLVTEYGWGAEEIAELWDLQDGCGGSGHSHGAGH